MNVGTVGSNNQIQNYYNQQNHIKKNDSNIVFRFCITVIKIIIAPIKYLIKFTVALLELIFGSKSKTDFTIKTDPQIQPTLTNTSIADKNLEDARIIPNNNILLTRNSINIASNQIAAPYKQEELFSELDLFLREETNKIPPLNVKVEDIVYETEKNPEGKEQRVMVGSGMGYRAYLARHKQAQN